MNKIKIGLKRGDSGNDVLNLQKKLFLLGYLENINQIDLQTKEMKYDNLVNFRIGFFDQRTELALKLYQKTKSLEVNGIVDEQTYNALPMICCGFDYKNNLLIFEKNHDYDTYSIRSLQTLYTYSFENVPIVRSSDEIKPTEMYLAIEQAFAVWSKEIPIAFRQVNYNSDIKIYFGTVGGFLDQDIRCEIGGSVDPRNTLPLTGESEVHFNLLEECKEEIGWFYDSDDGTGTYHVDFVTVAIHEIGHVLGLLHEPNPIMSIYSGNIERNLYLVNIEHIQALYGIVKIVSTSIIHGNTLLPQIISNDSEIIRFGNSASIHSSNYGHSWYYLSIPTINKLANDDQYINSVTVKLRTYYNIENENSVVADLKIEKIEVWDGDIRLTSHRIDLKASNFNPGISTHELKIGIASKPKVKSAISIAILIKFYGKSIIDIINASCFYTVQSSKNTPPVFTA